MNVAVRLNVWPVQSGELYARAGDDGIPKTFTLTVPGALVHPPAVEVTEYMPVASVDAAVIVGFCNDEVNEFGPLQL
jgi:hypothetical protein